jgi:hypothetical protein
MAHSMMKIPVFLFSFVLLLSSAGCGPPSGDWSGTSNDDIPELTDEAIKDRINDTRVFDVPPEDRQGESISWSFDEDEPKEVTIVERSVEDDTHVTVILEITTRSSPRSREPKELTGRIKTSWQFESGWAFRRWEVKWAENLSMKYKKLPKPPETNGNVSRDEQDRPQGNANANANSNRQGPPPPPPLRPR